jgi:hypothetical protein
MNDPLIRLDDPTATEALTTLAANFRRLSDGFIEHTDRQLDLARAAGDEVAVVREHIKSEVMRAARKMFRGSYRAVAGEDAWEDVEGGASEDALGTVAR